MLKQFLGLVAIALTLYSFYPYIRSIRSGEIKPHAFSWVIWGLSTSIVFFAQLADGGGAGAWAIGISGAITFYVALLSFTNKGDFTIKKVDWLFLILALLSLPFWFITSDPLWAVVILTTVDTLGFGPTLRNAYKNPHDEQILFYLLFTIRNAITLFALENLSLTTTLFPIVTALGCIILISAIMIRRKAVKRCS
ncbi:hypothetical protein MLD52_03540 [Puniceicoccaceae bacterium K14]|nr:hypothetical protein [Puniceicoccaceae bacterium K14]